MPGKTRTSLSINAAVQLFEHHGFTRVRQADEHAGIMNKVIQSA
jgi:hypothetical protein